MHEPITASEPHQQRHRILIVEDNELICFAYDRILSKSDSFVVDIVKNGREALELAREGLSEDLPHSVAFVDYHLNHEWDGLDTINRLREVNPDLFVVLCSAYAEEVDRTRIRSLDPNGRLVVLKKPFESIEIRQLATALTASWTTTRQDAADRVELAQLVTEQTEELRRAHQRLLDLHTELREDRGTVATTN